MALCLVEAGLQACLWTPNDPLYQSSNTSYFSNTAKLQPACIFSPTTAAQVSAAVRALSAADERFAIRSGGHAPLRNSNNIDGGVTIDLGSLDSIQYDNQTKLVTFGPGVRWKHVYLELAKYDRVVAGGREGETGVAGFLLGGGNTWYTAQKGFACDNVVSYEIVLADGQQVTATQNSHAELFRALKGGSNNFGVVVSFTMKTMPGGNIWGGTTLMSKEYTSDAIQAVTDFTANVSKYPDSSLIVGINYIPQMRDIVVGGALVETRDRNGSPAFVRWSRIPTIVDTTASKSLIEMGRETALPSNMYTTWFTLTVKNDYCILSKAVEVHSTLVDDLKTHIPDGDFLTQCIFQPLPQTFCRSSYEAGGNVLGLKRADLDGIILQLNAMVKNPDQSNFARRKIEAGIEVVKEFAGTIEGGLQDWIYLNYTDGNQDPIGSYGAENVEFMQRVAAAYDPHRVFQRLCPGGFKLLDAKQVV
ncbi:hypothetical protein F4808DRAFT_47462 [Astrocystis sublimbata]|nr:hypothetical protein F4808DRAFT_47462 [Astrocystis sublimbata]